jgi:hypothetical protein
MTVRCAGEEWALDFGQELNMIDAALRTAGVGYRAAQAVNLFSAPEFSETSYVHLAARNHPATETVRSKQNDAMGRSLACPSHRNHYSGAFARPMSTPATDDTVHV